MRLKSPTIILCASSSNCTAMKSVRQLPGAARHYVKMAKASEGKQKYVPHGGSYPKGFKVGAVHCGIKEGSGKLDLGLITSENGCNAGAVYTLNAFQAAPVQVSKQVQTATGGANINGVVINSGCANAVTGKQGLDDAKWMSSMADQICELRHASTKRSHTLVMSTGVIGQMMPMDKVRSQFTHLKRHMGNDHEHWMNLAKAFMTTDTFPKLRSRQFDINGITYSVAGISKGAGMIHPNMATLLGVMATDAPLDPKAAQDMVKWACDRSFNSITVDGDTSTNDTVALLANGAAGGHQIRTDTPEYATVQNEVASLAQELAHLVVRDGEGSTKFVTVQVNDAGTEEQAKMVGRAVAQSSLVKTALYGQDANWGRILCSIGYSGAQLSTHLVNVAFVPPDDSPKLVVLKHGEPQPVDEARASALLALEDVTIEIYLGTGGGQSSTVWTCDLSHEYVSINADYRS